MPLDTVNALHLTLKKERLYPWLKVDVSDYFLSNDHLPIDIKPIPLEHVHSSRDPIRKAPSLFSVTASYYLSTPSPKQKNDTKSDRQTVRQLVFFLGQRRFRSQFFSAGTKTRCRASSCRKAKVLLQIQGKDGLNRPK